MLNIVIPMAGRGSRFVKEGFSKPKPLIDINGKTMIQLVIENLKPSIPHRFIFIVQKEHIKKYTVNKLLESLSPDCIIIPIEEITQGAACSVLKSKKYINNDQPLMIANSDQWVNISINDYLDFCQNSNVEGQIMTMFSNDPKWSYINFDNYGNIIDVVEKIVVSNQATVGIYNFSRGEIFCKYAEQMIIDKNMSKGEYYVAPVYKYMIQNKQRIELYNIDKDGQNMYGLGTPDDLKYFIDNNI
tara:strand:- start:2403 stop:3134 length:732 start_codon:yes stop_codon:yes gene_type:complete